MRTRNASNKARNRESSHPLATSSSHAEGTPGPEHTDTGGTKGLLERALREVKEMKCQLDALRKRNHELEGASQEPRRTRRPVSKNDRKLDVRNKYLEERHKKDLERIRRLQAQAIKADADELMNDNHLATGSGDTENIMRQLLRMFSDLMEATTVEMNDKIQCAICLLSFPMNKFLSSPCEHLTCETCLPELLKDLTTEGTVPCPYCRKPCASDSFQRLQYTESERWDELLKVATEWAKLDAPDLDPEGIGDETGTEDNVHEDSSLSELESDNESSNTELITTRPPAATPPSVQLPSYSRSTPDERRHRLTQLAKQREQKKRGRI